MKHVILPILVHSVDTKTQENIGLPIDYEYCRVIDMVFYRIDNISPVINKDGSLKPGYSEITSGGYDGTVGLSPIEVMRRIEESFK